MISKRMALRKKDSAVSPVIATILMVAITVVLAAVLYVMVGGFTHNPGTAASAGLTETQSSTKYWNITVTSVSASNIQLSGLRIVVNGTSWSGNPMTGTAGSGVASVAVVVLSGNSNTYLESGDMFTVVATTPNALTGASVTLYNGNSQLGSTILS